ncbi:MAG TPA: hypothetical protein VGH33_11660 [Isosphaeraceae bacterium]
MSWPLVVALLAPGCERPGGEALVVATPWPSTQRAAIEADYHKADPSGRPIAWLPLAPGDDASRIAPGVDLVLGVPASDLDAITAEGVLTPIADGDRRPWRVARRLTLGLDVDMSATPPITGSSLTDRSLASLVALDDPRRDPIALAWAKARLSSLGWPKGYAELVRTAANARRVGRAGSARERVARGEAAVGPDADVVGPLDEKTALVRLDGAPHWLEGVALVAASPRIDDARAFVAFLANRVQAEPVPDDFPAPEPVTDALLADLLGATLVDAQDELWAAADALDRTGHPEPFEGYLDHAPPWPPTSIQKLRRQAEADELLGAMAREIGANGDARAWLMRSWDGPERKIDGSWIRELAGAAGGLAREPRFRTWLRGEWTAWARQHYRRIAREAGKAAS